MYTETEKRKIDNGAVVCTFDVFLPDGTKHALSTRVPLEQSESVETAPAVFDDESNLIEAAQLEAVTRPTNRADIDAVLEKLAFEVIANFDTNKKAESELL